MTHHEHLKNFNLIKHRRHQKKREKETYCKLPAYVCVYSRATYNIYFKNLVLHSDENAIKLNFKLCAKNVKIKIMSVLLLCHSRRIYIFSPAVVN